MDLRVSLGGSSTSFHRGSNHGPSSRWQVAVPTALSQVSIHHTATQYKVDHSSYNCVASLNVSLPYVSIYTYTVQRISQTEQFPLHKILL